MACGPAVGHGHTDRVAGERSAVAKAVTTAQAVASHIQALDGLPVLVQDVLGLVGDDTAHGDHHRVGGVAGGAGAAEERSGVDGHHVRCILAVVAVHACIAQLVVVCDAVQEVLLGSALVAQQVCQLVQGVGTVNGTGHLGALGQVCNGDGVGLTGHGVVHVLLDLIPVVLHAKVGCAVVQRSSLQGLGPVGVGDVAGQTGGLTQAGGLHLSNGALVHEALAAAVQHQHGSGAPGAGSAAADGHPATGGGLDHAACPAGHLVALAVAGACRGPAVSGRAAALSPLHALVQQRPAHLGVADEVACAQDDALVAVVAVVGAVCALGVHAGDLAALVLDELDALALKVPGTVGGLLHILDDVLVDVLDVVALIAVELGVAGPGQVAAAADGVAGLVLAVSCLGVAQRVLEHIAQVVVTGTACGLAVHPLVAGLAVAGGLGHDDSGIGQIHVAVVGLALFLIGVVDLLIAVEHLAGILHEVLDDLGVHTACGTLAELGGDGTGVIGAIAALDQQLGVDVADVLAVPAAHVGAGAVQVHKVAPGLLFNDRHGSALIHSTKGCADAGMAAAHDDHIIGTGLLILVGVCRSLTQPVAGAAVAGHTAGHFGRLRLFHLSAGSLCDTVGYALLDGTHGGHQRAAGHSVHIGALALHDGLGHGSLFVVGQQVLLTGGSDLAGGDAVGIKGHGDTDLGVGDGLGGRIGARGVLVLGGCGAAGGCGGAAGTAACQQTQRSGTAASGSNVAQEAAARDLALHLVTSFLLLHRSCVGPALLLQV